MNIDKTFAFSSYRMKKLPNFGKPCPEITTLKDSLQIAIDDAVLHFRDIVAHLPKLIVQYTDNTICTGDKFNQGCYHLRNSYLVDNSSILICYYDGHFDSITGSNAKYYFCEPMQI